MKQADNLCVISTITEKPFDGRFHPLIEKLSVVPLHQQGLLEI